MGNLTTTTTIGAFFAAIASAIQSGASLAAGRVYVVDKLRLQDAAVPNIQIEPVSMIPLSENTGVQVCIVEYKVHAVVKVERDLAGRMTERLVDDRSSFLLANTITGILKGIVDTVSYSKQVFIRMDGGAYDEAEGLTTTAASFKCHLRTLSDG